MHTEQTTLHIVIKRHKHRQNTPLQYAGLAVMVAMGVATTQLPIASASAKPHIEHAAVAKKVPTKHTKRTRRGKTVKPMVEKKHRLAPITKEEEQLLILTMWGEARNYGKGGMRAVGHVAMNRYHAQKPRYGFGMKAVLWKLKQFSCWNRSDPNREAMRHIKELPEGHPDRVAYDIAKKLARRIISGADKDNTVGATYYHTETIVPYWRKDMKPVGVMFGHIFYKPKVRVTITD